MPGANGKGGNGGGKGTHTDDGNNSVLKSGRGDDTYFVSIKGTSVDEKTNGGIDTVVASVDYWLDPNVENLTLADGGDLNGSGNELDNTLLGNTGSNTLSGLSGNDYLFGLEGDDILFGGAGSDQIDGGDGHDTAQFDGELASYSFLVEGDFVYVTSTEGYQDRLFGVEMLSFSDATLLVVHMMPPEEPGEAPVAVDDYATVRGGGELTLAVLTNDLGQGLSIAAVTDGISGAVTINEDGTIGYTPVDGAVGQDSFSYTIIDDSGRTATASVILELVDGNTAPTAVDDVFTITDGEILNPGTGVLDNDSDPDGDTLSVTGYDSVSASGGAVVVNADGTFIYSAASGFLGTDTFGYTIEDGQGGISAATVTVEVGESQSSDTPHYVTGLIRGEDYRYNPGDPVGTAATVTYAFADATPDYYYDGHFAWTNFEAFSEEMRDVTREALSQISEFADITFVETAVEDAGMVFGIADILGSASGLAYYPNAFTEGAPAGDVWIDSSLSELSFENGTEEFKTLIHEIGHSLGLQHAILPMDELNRQYTVMSDAEHPTFDAEPGSMQLYDVAALQSLYGANDSATAGDDVYAFDSLSESATTIWDSGGHDTLDLSSATYGVILDLHEGTFSTVGSNGADNLAIAFGTQLEDAFGSSHDDIITGNEIDNYISGGDGNDALSGGGGADVFGFSGAAGTDRISDFTRGEDKLAFNGPETSIDDLAIVLQDYGILVEHSGGSILLDGVEELDEEDLLFAFA